MTGTPDHDPTAELTAAVTLALATRSRDAFTAMLTDDVHWAAEHSGYDCTNRAQAGDHYAGLIAAGVTLHITAIRGENETLTATGTFTAELHMEGPDPKDYPRVVTVRLTLRDGLIADIRELDAPPTIELLYFDGCPNHETFLPHLRHLLHDHGINAPVTFLRIENDDDARTHRFLGSPTLRVNGLDVEPAALDRHSYALQCRRYSTRNGPTGTPSDRWILDALIENPNLHIAVEAIHTGDLTSLQRVLTEQPDLATSRSVRHGGRTLLLMATDWPGHFPNVAATIKALVQSGADPNTPSIGEHAETPLHWAASSGDLDALDALLDAGADIDARGAVIAGGTALADANAFGEWAAARRLVERGAQRNLFEAAALGLVDQVEALLDTGHPTADDITSSFWGACHGGQLATAATLLDSGADINWIGYDGLTPLDAAQRAGASQLAIWLVHHGATASHTH